MGSVVGGYRVVSLIGSGAMGSVFLAEESVGRRVAVKVLIPEFDQDERFRRRFLRESELAVGLRHPHVVPTLGSGEDEGRLYLAMAYVEGSDLRALLRSEGGSIRTEPSSCSARSQVRLTPPIWPASSIEMSSQGTFSSRARKGLSTPTSATSGSRGTFPLPPA